LIQVFPTRCEQKPLENTLVQPVQLFKVGPENQVEFVLKTITPGGTRGLSGVAPPTTFRPNKAPAGRP
jgi:hypothetical protein